MNRKNIQVSPETHKKLNIIKIKTKSKDLNEVIARLIEGEKHEKVDKG